MKIIIIEDEHLSAMRLARLLKKLLLSDKTQIGQ